MKTDTANIELNNPFPGLQPFQRGQEHLFFGRENQTDELVDRLQKTHFLAVVGSSGCGKSSLVQCGLLNALRIGLMSESGTTWRIVSCRPAGQPMKSLATALAEPGVLFEKYDSKTMKLVDIIDATLHMSTRGISDVFELSKQKPTANLLVVVDQFEELFRYSNTGESESESSNKSKTEATQFIKLLLNASRQVHQRIYIVLTMRSDFLGDCARFDGLAQAINEGQYLVPRMTRNERRSAISGPVGVSGATIDSILLTKLINDLGDDPDQLSIMQHALNRIWTRWQEIGRHQDPLSLTHYSAIGSMKQALDNHAEKVFAELDPIRQQPLCEKIFKALTNKATDSRGVRRPTSLALLVELTEAPIEELVSVIDAFRKPSRSFLMPPMTQKLDQETVIDISHESLMRMWRRLLNWANEEAESTRTYQRLASTATLHANGKAGLWRDPDLQLALEWRMRNTPNESWASRIAPGFDKAMIFLDDSRIAADQETAEKIRRTEKDRELERSQAISSEQQRTIAAQRRASRKQRQITLLVIGGLIVTSLLSITAFNQAGTLKANVDEMKALASNEKRANDEMQEVLSAAVVLLNEKEVINTERRTERKFTNRTKARVQIFKLDKMGIRSEPMLIGMSESSVLKGVENQLWLARSVSTGRLISTGFLDSRTESIDIVEAKQQE